VASRSRFPLTRCQTWPPPTSGGAVAILVVIVIIVMLNPAPALITACASLALAARAAGIPTRRRTKGLEV